MHYLHKMALASGGFAPRYHQGSIPGPRKGTFVPRPPIYPPLEKILRAPMSKPHRYRQILQKGISSSHHHIENNGLTESSWFTYWL